MRGRLIAPLLLGLAYASGAAPTTAYSAPVLREVKSHLAQAHQHVSDNILDVAKAHATVVLVGAQVHLSINWDGVPADRQADYLSTLKSAAETWETALNGDVHFVIDSDAAKPDVRVSFKPDVKLKGEPIAGYVHWKRQISQGQDQKSVGVYTADLQLRTRNLSGKNMPLDAMRHTAMHELGHVLGLDDSSRMGDVMGPLDIDCPAKQPGPMEVETVRMIRAEAEDIIRTTDSTGKRQ